MSKIKVLWIMTGGLRRNGICVSQLAYAKLLNKSKFTLDVLAVHNNSSDMIDEYSKAGCNVVCMPDRRKHLFKYLTSLNKLIKKQNYDVIHVFGSTSLMYLELKQAKKNNIPLRIAHSRNTTCDRLFLEKIMRGIFTRTYNMALACGADAGNWLFGENQYTILHNGKDLKKYSFNPNIRTKIRSQYNIENKIAFGHVGNFNYQKNHEFLIDVFKNIHDKNSDTILFLMGSGELFKTIQEKVKDYNLDESVVFLGSIDNVDEVIQGMDIMLFPSRFEGLPNVVIEWQASGLPCVLSSNITSECKVADNVYFCSIENGINEWYNCVKNIDINIENRKKISKNNCKLLKQNNYDIYDNTKILEKFYIEGANNRK